MHRREAEPNRMEVAENRERVHATVVIRRIPAKPERYGDNQDNKHLCGPPFAGSCLELMPLGRILAFTLRAIILLSLAVNICRLGDESQGSLYSVKSDRATVLI